MKLGKKDNKKINNQNQETLPESRTAPNITTKTRRRNRKKLSRKLEGKTTEI